MTLIFICKSLSKIFNILGNGPPPPTRPTDFTKPTPSSLVVDENVEENQGADFDDECLGYPMREYSIPPDHILLRPTPNLNSQSPIEASVGELENDPNRMFPLGIDSDRYEINLPLHPQSQASHLNVF